MLDRLTIEPISAREQTLSPKKPMRTEWSNNQVD